VNRINRNFAQLLLAYKRGNIAMQKGLMRQFHRIGLSIVRSKGWFHPDEIDGWNSAINLTIAQQLARFAGWKPIEVLMGIGANRFAYLYRAIENGLTDEVRRLFRRSREVSTPLEEEPFASLVGARINLDRNIQCQQLVKLVDEALEGVVGNCPFEAILRKLREWVSQPEHIPEDTRVEMVRFLSANLHVSLQQARTYMRNFADFASRDERLQRLIAALRASVREHDQQEKARVEARAD
jgi:hypothetical protein